MQTTTHGKLTRALGIAVLSCVLALCAYAAALCADTTPGAQSTLAETAYASIYTGNTTVGNKTFVFNKKNGDVGGLQIKHKGSDKIVSATSSKEKIATVNVHEGDASIFLEVNHVGTAKVHFKTKSGKHYTITIKTTKKMAAGLSQIVHHGAARTGQQKHVPVHARPKRDGDRENRRENVHDAA